MASTEHVERAVVEPLLSKVEWQGIHLLGVLSMTFPRLASWPLPSEVQIVLVHGSAKIFLSTVDHNGRGKAIILVRRCSQVFKTNSREV